MCLTGDSFLQLSHMKSLFEACDANMDDLVHEVPQAERLIERKVKKGVAKLTAFTEFLRFINLYKEAFQELFRLCKIAVTIPGTSASAKTVVLKLGSAVLLGSARQIFWDREAPSKKIKTTILKKKFCVKLSFQATFLPINLTNTICHETLQAT